MSKVDVHHHVLPPLMREAVEQALGGAGWYAPAWTVELDKAMTAAIDVKTAILSVTAPGPTIVKDPAKAALLARQCNEYIAALRDDDPSGFGFFATMPSLLDTKASLEEISYAFDTLGADGITLFTRYGDDNHYLGHPDFEPIWSELNRRKAVVFVHPGHAVHRQPVNNYLQPPMFDWPHETGRTAIDLITRGAIRAYPECKIILSHAGGTLPSLLYRAVGMVPYLPESNGLSTAEMVQDAREFYFDTAISSNPVTLKALFEFAKPGHVLFGSDFPYAPKEFIENNTRFLEDYELPPMHKRGDIYRDAALQLIPRLRKYYS